MQYAALKLQLSAITETLQSRNIIWRFFSWGMHWKAHSVRFSAAYQDARLQFISCNRLPHDFAFNVYLKRCIRQVFVELLHIHWGIWLCVGMLVQLDLFVQTSFINPARLRSMEDEQERQQKVYSSSSGSMGSDLLETVEKPPSPISFIDYCCVIGFLVIVGLAIIYWKMITVQERCFKSDLMEFNVWEELMWMMQQQKLQGQRQRHVEQRKFLGKVKMKYKAPMQENQSNLAFRQLRTKRHSVLQKLGLGMDKLGLGESKGTPVSTERHDGKESPGRVTPGRTPPKLSPKLSPRMRKTMSPKMSLMHCSSM